jgi:hypothetical protein
LNVFVGFGKGLSQFSAFAWHLWNWDSIVTMSNDGLKIKEGDERLLLEASFFGLLPAFA